MKDAGSESSKTWPGNGMGDGGAFLDAGMETIIIVGWLAVGGGRYHADAITGLETIRKKQAKRTAQCTRRVIRRNASSLNA